MSDEFETVEVNINITAGEDFETRIRFPTVKGTERVYWAAASYGAVGGVAEASSALIDLIPDGAGVEGEVLKAAGQVLEKVKAGY